MKYPIYRDNQTYRRATNSPTGEASMKGIHYDPRVEYDARLYKLWKKFYEDKKKKDDQNYIDSCPKARHVMTEELIKLAPKVRHIQTIEDLLAEEKELRK